MSPITQEKAIVTLDLDTVNQEFSRLSAQERLAWTYETFPEGSVVFSSSFGSYSAGLLHMISQVKPKAPVVFLETGFHFPETIQFRDQLIQDLDLELAIYQRKLSDSEFTKQLGDKPYQSNPDQCCHLNKVEPMQDALKGKQAWISGLRGQQTEHRAGLSFVIQTKDGLYKIHPLLDWPKARLLYYIEQNNLPLHPLTEKGSSSIGCWPCTQVPSDGDERSGRWQGQGKTECGLHFM